jgi:hypothetical protein
MCAKATVQVPEGICDCDACTKLAALAADPWSWDKELELRELQSRRRQYLAGGIGLAARCGDTVSTIPLGGLL